MKKIINIFNSRKQFILFSALKFFVLFLSLFTNVFIVKKLSVNDYGIFSIAFMLVGLLTTFGFSWSSSSITYYGSKEKIKYGSINKTFWARNIIIFISLLFVTVLFFTFKTNIDSYIGIDFSLYILIWLYLSVIEDYLNQYFLAVKKQIMSSMLSITAKVLYLVFVIFFSFDVKTLIILNIVSHSSVLLYFFGIKKNDIGKFEYDKEWFKEVLNFSVWQLFGFSGLYLINYGDVVVIKHFMSMEDVAIYNAAYKLFNAVANFAFVISSFYASSLSQYFEEKNSKKIKSFFYKDRISIFLISLVGHLVVMILSRPIILLLYGTRYVDSIAIFNVLMIGSIIRYWTVYYMLYFNTNKKHKVLQLINIFRAIINFVLDIFLIKVFGLIGPAIATVIAMFITGLYSYYYCEKDISRLSKELK
jgi:O-antigen/teichoic acid export membrane protein